MIFIISLEFIYYLLFIDLINLFRPEKMVSQPNAKGPRRFRTSTPRSKPGPLRLEKWDVDQHDVAKIVFHLTKRYKMI